MNTKFYKFSTFLLLTIFTFLLFFSPVFAIEKFNNSLKEAGAGTGHTVVNPENADNQIYSSIGNTIKVLLGLVGIVFLILIIYAGYIWMLARGNEAEAQKAKDTLTRAIIGLFIVLSAYAITAFIGGSF